MTTQRIFMNSMMRPLLGFIFIALLLVGCGSGGGGSNNPKPPVSTTTLKGAAFVPKVGGTAKPIAQKVIPDIPNLEKFVGATVIAKSIEDKTEYPQNGTAVGGDGTFTITGVPAGKNYLLMAKKGTMVVMKLISVPVDPP